MLNLTGQSFLTASNAKTWLNTNGYWTSWISSSFDSDAQAFITAAAITNPTQQTAINGLVVGLKADSLWTTLDAIYPFVGGTATTHKYNLKDPRDLDAAYRLQFNGGMTHSANGILFNGINGWADTSAYNFSIGYFGCYTRNASDNGKDYMGSQGSELIDDGDGPYFVYINGFQLARDSFILSSRTGFGPTNNIISTGLSVVTKKTSSGQSVYYKNGIQRGSANNPVNTLGANPPIAIGALNPNSDLSAGTVGIEGYSNQEIAFAFIGNSQLDATQNTNLYNRIQTFQTTLGRQAPTLAGSLLFNGSSQYLTISPGIIFGAGAYTVEGWFYNNSNFNNKGILGSPVTSPTGCMNLHFSSNTVIQSDKNGGGGSFAFTMASAISLNAWHYFIYNRNSNGVAAVYIDGVRSTTTSTDTLNYNTATDTIGRDYAGYWPGHWTNMRITIGTAVYDSSQTTQLTPTSALTSLVNTKYLMLGAVVTTDTSGVQTVTNVGGVTQSSVKPF